MIHFKKIKYIYGIGSFFLIINLITSWELQGSASFLPEADSPSPGRKIKNILCLEGKEGVISSTFLADLEEKSKKSIAETYDLIIGVGTGALLALYLTAPKEKSKKNENNKNSPEDNKKNSPIDDSIFSSYYKGRRFSSSEIQQNMQLKSPEMHQRGFLHNISTIWGYNGPLYDKDGKEKFLKESFNDLRFSDTADLTKVCIIVTDLALKKPVMLNNFEAKTNEAFNFYLKDLGLATTINLGEFQPAKIINGKKEAFTFIDASNMCANPTSLGIHMARGIFGDVPLNIVSIGDGAVLETFNSPRYYSSLNEITLKNGVINFVNDVLQKSFEKSEGKYFRLQASFTEKVANEINRTPAHYTILKRYADDAISAQSQTINEIIYYTLSSLTPIVVPSLNSLPTPKKRLISPLSGSLPDLTAKLNSFRLSMPLHKESVEKSASKNEFPLLDHPPEGKKNKGHSPKGNTFIYNIDSLSSEHGYSSDHTYKRNKSPSFKGGAFVYNKEPHSSDHAHAYRRSPSPSPRPIHPIYNKDHDSSEHGSSRKPSPRPIHPIYNKDHDSLDNGQIRKSSPYKLNPYNNLASPLSQSDETRINYAFDDKENEIGGEKHEEDKDAKSKRGRSTSHLSSSPTPFGGNLNSKNIKRTMSAERENLTNKYRDLIQDDNSASEKEEELNPSPRPSSVSAHFHLNQGKRFSSSRFISTEVKTNRKGTRKEENSSLFQKLFPDKPPLDRILSTGQLNPENVNEALSTLQNNEFNEDTASSFNLDRIRNEIDDLSKNERDQPLKAGDSK